MIPPLMLGQLCRMINTQLEYHSLYKFEQTCGLCPYELPKDNSCVVFHIWPMCLLHGPRHRLGKP